jgi:hypothetical protein
MDEQFADFLALAGGAPEIDPRCDLVCCGVHHGDEAASASQGRVRAAGIVSDGADVCP